MLEWLLSMKNKWKKMHLPANAALDYCNSSYYMIFYSNVCNALCISGLLRFFFSSLSHCKTSLGAWLQIRELMPALCCLVERFSWMSWLKPKYPRLWYYMNISYKVILKISLFKIRLHTQTLVISYEDFLTLYKYVYAYLWMWIMLVS